MTLFRTLYVIARERNEYISRRSHGCWKVSSFQAKGSGTDHTSQKLLVPLYRKWVYHQTLQISLNAQRSDHSTRITWLWQMSWLAPMFCFHGIYLATRSNLSPSRGRSCVKWDRTGYSFPVCWRIPPIKFSNIKTMFRHTILYQRTNRTFTATLNYSTDVLVLLLLHTPPPAISFWRCTSQLLWDASVRRITDSCNWQRGRFLLLSTEMSFIKMDKAMSSHVKMQLIQGTDTALARCSIAMDPAPLKWWCTFAKLSAYIKLASPQNEGGSPPDDSTSLP